MMPKLIKLETFNQLLTTFFQEWCTNSFFEVALTQQKYIAKKIQRKLNKDRPSFFDSFVVSSLRFEKNPAKINGIKALRSEPFEFLSDIDFEYDGLIELVIDTTVSINLTVVGLADCSRKSTASSAASRSTSTSSSQSSACASCPDATAIAGSPLSTG